MKQTFVTGMLRSGTSLIQTLLTNHPQLFVAYQPFHQFYVDIRQRFLDEHNISKALPLGDGMDSSEEERNLFRRWIKDRRFNTDETNSLVARATSGKGGGAKDFGAEITARSGNFFDILEQLHILLSDRFRRDTPLFIGAKEVLCEEYIPALIDSSVRCLIIVRDPRAVIASACNGRYQELVGDRYPLLMLIRLWRKSAAYWLAFRNHPLVHAIRYEDLVKKSDSTLHEISTWLDIAPFPEGLIHRPLLDQAGKIWKGNSSFGDMTGVESSSTEAWQALLTNEEIRFIEACTKPELNLLGYRYSDDLERRDISAFTEDTRGVRETYLSIYSLFSENKEQELKRWNKANLNQYDNYEENEEMGLFLFPETFSRAAP